MAVEESSPFGERLRRLREAAGLTQEALSERAGITAKGIASLETGRRQHPYPHTVRALADALQLSGKERETLLASVPRRGAAGSPAGVPPPAPQAVPRTPLLGRGRELGEILDLWSAHPTPLVTITGAGGVGKTRLALELASELSHLYPDGVAFVALAPISDPTLVLSAVARSVGVREVSGQSLRSTLRAHLREKRLLLILDNCEHVLDMTAEAVEVIWASGGVGILGTSRSPLRLRGENEYPLGPLETPELSRVPRPADLALNPAVELFTE